MPHTTVYDPEFGIIVMKAQGLLAAAEAEEMMTEVVQLAQQKACFLWLSDCRKAELSMSFYGIFRLPLALTKIAAQYGLSALVFKHALVAEDLEGDYRNFETVALNTGQMMQLFLEVEEARRWLLKT